MLYTVVINKRVKRLCSTLLIGLSLSLLANDMLPGDMLPPQFENPNAKNISNKSHEDHAVILLYHHVDNNSPAVTSVTPTIFEQQLQYLEKHRFQVWPLTKVIDHLQNKRPTPDKVVAITFDDSYRSVYTQAYPRLKQRGWPFTIFVTTEAVDLRYNNQTSWQELRTMAVNGATIANHSLSHAHMLQRLEAETDQQWTHRMRAEIDQAAQRIEAEIGESPPLFAYPYGESNPRLKQLVAELGYTALGQQSGPVGNNSDWLAIPRFAIAGQYSGLEDFALRLMTLPMPLASASAIDNPLPHSLDRPTLTLNFLPGRLSKQQLQCFGSGQGALNLDWTGDHTVSVKPSQAIPNGRSRYNCTAQAKSNEAKKRFYWYSHPWIRRDKNGHLPRD